MPSRARSRTRGLDPAKLATVRSALQGFVDRGELSGVVTLASLNGEVVETSAIGWSDIETRTPMRPDTLFRIASMTKPVTSVAALMLIEEGRIALSDPISRWIPELAEPLVLRDAAGPRRDGRSPSRICSPIDRASPMRPSRKARSNRPMSLRSAIRE